MCSGFRHVLLLLLCGAASASSSGAWAAEWNPAARTAADVAANRFLVRLADKPEESVWGRAEAVRALAARAGVGMRRLHQPSSNLHAVTLDERTPAGLKGAISRLMSDPEVVSVEVDAAVARHDIVPNDPLYAPAGGQWYLKSVSADEVRSSINAAGAWVRSRGSAETVVALLDSGVRFDHPDLRAVSAGGRLLPGYDFVSADADGRFLTANDGDGWDADPSDPGDWVDHAYLADGPPFSACLSEDSSWHGTRTAGLLAAVTNNAVGIASVDWQAKLLPIRALGRCGGYISDVLAGLRWAAGLDVPGVPRNPHPARVINLSLGGKGACTPSQQAVIDEVTRQGVLIVASAGNDRGVVGAPANCRGVLGVAGLRHAGTKVGYSNIGPEVGVSAPSGNCVNSEPGMPCLYSIDTTTDEGRTVPLASGYTDRNRANVGTSFAAPLVAGVAALLFGIDPGLTPAEVIDLIQKSAAPFPSDPTLPMCPTLANGSASDGQCNCTTSQCGAGMLNAGAAVEKAQARLFNADRLFDWAEWKYPELFSPPAVTQNVAGYLARAYRDGTYLGVAGGRLYLFGPPWGNEPLDVGSVELYWPRALGDRF